MGQKYHNFQLNLRENKLAGKLYNSQFTYVLLPQPHAWGNLFSDQWGFHKESMLCNYSCIHCIHFVMYSASLMMCKSSSRKLGRAWVTSLTGQTQPTPAQITFSITHREGRVWWHSVGFCVLCCDCCVDNLIGYGHMTLSWPQHVKPLNWKTNVAKFVTHASTYSINDFIKYFPCDFQHLMHFMYTRKPAECHRTLSSPCMILKVIRAGVGWVWLVRLPGYNIPVAKSFFTCTTSLVLNCFLWPCTSRQLFVSKQIEHGVCYVCCDWDY